MTPSRPDDEGEPRELSRGGSFDVAPVSPEEALGRLIEQQNREAAAGRAQARELIKALEGVQRSQEYLGVALREERARSRWLTALVVVTPLVAAAGAWLVWTQVGAVRGDVDRRFQELAASNADAAEKGRDLRVGELTSDVAALRRDLDVSREALAAERRQLAEREAVLAAAEGRGESAKSEIAALAQEVVAARAKANAEQQRSTQLEDRLRDARAQLSVRAAPAAPSTSVATPAAAAPAPTAVAVVEEKRLESKPPETTSGGPPMPPSSSAEAETTRVSLNALLEQSGDAVLYRFESIGGVSGRALERVLVVGTDEQGAVVRSIQAARAQITIDAGTGSVVVRFSDGKLIVGTKQAPFFDGTYGLVVRGDPAKWKASGLAADGD